MTKFKNILVAAATLVIFTNITHAQSVKASYSVNAEEPLKVKYLGDDGSYLLFQVILQSKGSSNALFTIDDKIEGELYSSGLPSAAKVQTIKIEKRPDQVLNFKLFLGAKAYSKSFSVNTNLVETVVVKENDLSRL
ncbi:MAG: hypothetical protein JWQ09_1316 [Segetibacter sp.]|nr:hypothetical protein [Segetibacter sp.]